MEKKSNEQDIVEKLYQEYLNDKLKLVFNDEGEVFYNDLYYRMAKGTGGYEIDKKEKRS